MINNIEFESAVTRAIKKSWFDEDFKSALIVNPKKMLFEEFGDTIDDEVSIAVVDAPDFTKEDFVINRSKNSLLIKIPPKSTIVNAELTDDQLEAVAGGNLLLANLVDKIEKITSGYSPPPES